MSYQRNRRKVLSVLIAAIIIISAGLATPLLSWNASTSGVQAQSGGNKQYIPFINKPAALPTPTPGPVTPTGNWTQHAHDALHTGFTTEVVSTPWRWKWSWNGSNASGGVVSGKFGLPRGSQPVTGGGRVYVSAGSRGVYALNNGNGAQVWNRNPGGSINSTPAYDPASDSLFVVSSNGHLYRLNASTGATTGDFNAQATSTLPLPPALLGDRVYFSMGNKVFAISRTTVGQVWAYDAGSPVHTPPAYSPSTGLVVAVSEDLYVHGIRNSDGGRAWRVKPAPLSGGNPGDNSNNAEVKYGWPVIAEVHGLVLIKLRLDWQTMWTWNPWPSSNAQMRSNLNGSPDQQALYALRLSDGGIAFRTNVGHGGFGDGGNMPMGPQPVVKRFSDGSEVAYVVMRGSPCQGSPCDGRYDSHLGEMLLDGSTVSGFQAGDVRFMDNTHFPTDEQPQLSMAGDQLFGGHWMFGIAHQILNRAANRGASAGTPITTSNLPHIITSSSSCPFSASHYCSSLTQDGDQRTIPGGFYIYRGAGKVYDQYWSGYASWIISGSNIYYVSTDGAVVALESGPTVQEADVPVEEPALEAAAPQVLDQPISYTQARESAGSIAAVEGQVQFMFNNGKAVLLGFENPHEGAFKAMILKADWGNFSAQPDQLFGPGQTIRVHGQIEWYQGDPVIYVHTPDQIEVTGEASIPISKQLAQTSQPRAGLAALL
jgi:outer membrane protein assembly factor BamB